jgi:hypothetical protein
LRYNFGMTPTDWVFQEGAGQEVILAAGVTLTFWNLQTGGVQYKDLVQDGTGVETIISGDGDTAPTGTIPRFLGPDGITQMWVDAGGDARYLMSTTDMGNLPARVGALEEAVNALQSIQVNTLYAMKYDQGTGEYPNIPENLVSTRYLIWIGPSVPVAARPGDLHIDTVE